MTVKPQVQTASTINALLGIWLIIAPFVLAYSHTASALWNDIIVGAVVLIVAGVRCRSPGQQRGLELGQCGFWGLVRDRPVRLGPQRHHGQRLERCGRGARGVATCPLERSWQTAATRVRVARTRSDSCHWTKIAVLQSDLAMDASYGPWPSPGEDEYQRSRIPLLCDVSRCLGTERVSRAAHLAVECQRWLR